LKWLSLPLFLINLNKKMRRQLLPFILFLIFSSQLYAQHAGSIKGRITTSDGTVASNVSVKLKGTSIGSITDEDGSYQIRKVPAGQYTLIVSAVGLFPKEKQVVVSQKGTVIADFSLQENQSQLDNVQISTRKKKFKVDKVSSSLRLQSSLLEVPQNIKVVTSQLIAEMSAEPLEQGIGIVNMPISPLVEHLYLHLETA
jgi:iron complex outermembrane receptor protein